MSKVGRPRKYLPVNRGWMRTMVRAMLPLTKEVLETNDDNMIRAIQACESVVWLKARPGESLISCIINTVLDRMDLSDPEKKFAHNIEVELEDILRWVAGLSSRLLDDTLNSLSQYGLIKITGYETTDEETVAVVKKLRLTPIWDRLLARLKEEGKAHTVYTESLGRMLACASIGGVGEGVNTIIPIVHIIGSSQDTGVIPTWEARDICMAYSFSRTYRKYTDLISHDSAKPEDIRLFTKEENGVRTVNPIVFVMMRRWREISLELWRKRVLT